MTIYNVITFFLRLTHILQKIHWFLMSSAFNFTSQWISLLKVSTLYHILNRGNRKLMVSFTQNFCLWKSEGIFKWVIYACEESAIGIYCNFKYTKEIWCTREKHSGADKKILFGLAHNDFSYITHTLPFVPRAHAQRSKKLFSTFAYFFRVA